MKSYLITFHSITLAQRAERAFEGQEIPCHMRRTPRWMEERGCGYAVEAKLADLQSGLNLLRQQGIPYRKSYRLNGDNTVEEVIP